MGSEQELQALERRVELLEARVAQLEVKLQSAQEKPKDWRRLIGAFTDDEGMQSILRDAMKLREADRKAAKRKPKRT